MLKMRVLGVAHLSSQLRSTQPTPLRMRFQFPNLHRQLNVSESQIVFSQGYLVFHFLANFQPHRSIKHRIIV